VTAVTSPETAEPWTILSVARWAAEDFKRRSFDSPRLDAELLLAHALGIDRIRVIIDATRTLSPEELSRYRELIKRRRSGEPIAYILGVREFYGLPFRVDRRVLIPRPDSEALVDTALERTRHWSLYGRALDLCTGSGCIAIAFAKRRPTWRVTGVDLSPDALTVARDNAFRLGAIWGVCFVVGDLFAPLGESERFELITANPPYVPSAELAELEPQIRHFEPHLALDGGPDGLDAIRRIVEQAAERLLPGGVLATEIHYSLGDAACALLERAGFVAIERRRDYGGHERVVSGVLSA
jgi:release factor glutamine methyltransferase